MNIVEKGLFKWFLFIEMAVFAVSAVIFHTSASGLFIWVVTAVNFLAVQLVTGLLVNTWREYQVGKVAWKIFWGALLGFLYS